MHNHFNSFCYNSTSNRNKRIICCSNTRRIICNKCNSCCSGTYNQGNSKPFFQPSRGRSCCYLICRWWSRWSPFRLITIPRPIMLMRNIWMFFRITMISMICVYFCFAIRSIFTLLFQCTIWSMLFFNRIWFVYYR